MKVRAHTRVAVFALGVAMVSCQSATQPSPPISPSPSPPGPDVLVILPAVSGITLGATAKLTAQIISGNLPGRLVAASWSSDAPDVAPIQPDGQLSGMQLGGTTVRAGYQDLTANLPLRVVPDYAGNWSGRYQVTACGRVSGPGPSPCRFTVGCCFGLRTGLTQDGARLSGTLELLNNRGDRVVDTGSVAGEIDGANALVLSGTLHAADPAESAQTTVSEWNTALTADGDGMGGTFIQDETYRNIEGNQHLRLTCKLEGFQRSKP